MKMHPRFQSVQVAKSFLSGAIITAVEEHGLTLIETAQLLQELAQQQLMYALRVERHGTVDKKAGEA